MAAVQPLLAIASDKLRYLRAEAASHDLADEGFIDNATSLAIAFERGQ
jgi:hypothetical protein